MITIGTKKELDKVLKIKLSAALGKGDYVKRKAIRDFVYQHHHICADKYNLSYVDITIDTWLKDNVKEPTGDYKWWSVGTNIKKVG